MSADPTATASSIVCGACSAPNVGGAQFCAGCGHRLYEPCFGCSKPVLLTQSFCGNCGCDLTKAIEKTRAKYQGWLNDAVHLTKQDEFEEALALLRRLKNTDDFRYRDLVENAKVAMEKVQKVAEHRRGLARNATDAAKSAIEEEDHERVVSILTDVPLRLVPDEVRQAFQRSKSFLENQGSLGSELKKAIAERDWSVAGPLAEQIVAMNPDSERYLKIAKKIGRQLFARAKEAFERRAYANSLSMLDSIPPTTRDAEYHSFRDHIENLQWLRGQFDGEPFDTPQLGRLALRLKQDEPADPRNEKRVERLAASLKQGTRPKRGRFPNRAGIPTSWAGGDLGILSSLTFTPLPDLPGLRGQWAKMNVAMGLALQGIGEGRITTQLVPKKGIFSRSKKAKLAYGIDIGSHAIKVVGLQRIEEKKKEPRIEMIDGFIRPFDQPLCRPGYDEDALSSTAALIDQILQEHEIGDAPVWINLPAGALISRFTLLPPVPDKQANELLDKEINERIPFEADTLHFDRWIAPYEPESTIGRPAALWAVKRQLIEQRLERLGLTDLNIVGMQADPIALVNLVSVEFREELEAELEDETKVPAVVLFDCGTETTSTIVVSRNAHWLWTNEFGGEELTGLLARELKQSRSEAEERKINVQNLPSPAKNFATIEARMDEWKSRLTKLVDEALDANPSFEVQHVFGCGGTCLAHQWFRRVLST